MYKRQELEAQKKISNANQEWLDEQIALVDEKLRPMEEEIDSLNGLIPLSDQLHAELKTAAGQKKARIVKRLEVVDAFRLSGNKPEWMVIDILPVIPPEIRPMVQLDGGRFATSDLNDLYRRVINRNNRLKRLIQLNAPDIIVRNEKRMLQEAVDALIDNGRRGRAVTGANNRALKSLSDMLKGKQGRFRQNLLGKRVDYSGRSVIVVGPDLKIYQCGVPKEMAIELFRPFVMKKLVEDGVANNIKSAKKMVDKQRTEVWDALDVVIKEHPVLLNRAPTLHRLGIQAFEPILVEGRALRLHPLVCTAYNADFDGDQMAIHVPLSAEAQAEARILMLSANNLLRPQDGHPVTVPTQDMILGSYYLTYVRLGKAEKGAEQVFVTDAGETGLPAGEVVDADEFVAANKAAKKEGKKEAEYRPLKSYVTPAEAIMAYNYGDIGIHAPILVRVEKTIDGVPAHKLIRTSVGRIIFNEPIPQDLGYVDRSDPERAFDHEIGFQVGKKQLGDIIDRCIQKYGFTISAEVLDNIKALGFKYSTKGAITISIADMTVPDAKKTLIEATENKVLDIEKQFRRGFITNDERYRLVVDEWEQTTKDVTGALQDCLDEYNPIYMMANSGARGSMNQIRQLAGMRGLMSNPSGKIIEVPVRACFREGLTVLEYFISSHGGRKGLADTALKTADSGYMTRRLVDVAQEVVIREEDCFAAAGEKPKGMWVSAITGDSRKEIIERLADRIMGRYAVEDIVHPETGEILCKGNEMISEDAAYAIEKAGIEQVQIRTALTCKAKDGICAKCYGKNMANGRPVNIGEAVGIIAAQSIGEPGTQLTMRTFHTGGVATADDITQGLPRIEELFEARRPKGVAYVCEYTGTVSMDEREGMRVIQITTPEGEVKDYVIPFSAKLRVKPGDSVEPGTVLTEGSVNPHDILKTKGVRGVQEYLTKEVQATYRNQGVEINDKHVEIIVRQMLRKVKVEDVGDTDILPGELVELYRFEEENLKALEAGKRPATAKRVLLGITKASLATDSFLAAASFQETARVLTEAAIKNKIDPLIGLKENVIIGKLIPAGTGCKEYRNISPVVTVEKNF